MNLIVVIMFLSKRQVSSFIIVCMAGQLTVYTWGRGKGSCDPMPKIFASLVKVEKRVCTACRLQECYHDYMCRVTCVHNVSMVYSAGE